MEFIYLGVCLLASFGLYSLLDRHNRITLFLHKILPQRGRNLIIMAVAFAVIIALKETGNRELMQSAIGVISGISIAFFGKFEKK